MHCIANAPHLITLCLLTRSLHSDPLLQTQVWQVMMKWKRNEDEAEAQHKASQQQLFLQQRRKKESGALPDGYVMTERGVLRPGAEEESTTSSLTIEDKSSLSPSAVKPPSSPPASSPSSKPPRSPQGSPSQASPSKQKSSATKAEMAAIKSPNTLGSGGREAGTVSGRDSPVPPRPVSPGAARPPEQPVPAGADVPIAPSKAAPAAEPAAATVVEKGPEAPVSAPEPAATPAPAPA